MADTEWLRVPDVVLEGTFGQEHEKRYAHLPFEVPEGVRQIHLRCRYNDRIDSDPALGGGNTLDVGLFDQHGTEGGGPGFRGWSGSELLALTVGDEWATPPYRPGPIGAGTWHVLLGPYKVGPRGLTYRVELFFRGGEAARHGDETDRMRKAERRAPRPSSPPVVAGWVRGDLHCHTRHSDGDSWPLEVLAAAGAIGLDFLGITDHNAALPHVPPSAESGLPLLIPGVEVTTYGGHWNAWGGRRWYDFREPDGAKVGVIMRQAVADGAFVSVNHPKPLGPDWTYPEASGYQAIEVWNGPWQVLNPIALAVWEGRLRRGERLVCVGGSDTHDLTPRPGKLVQPRLGQPTVWVEIGERPLSVATVLDGLKAGRCFVSAGPDGPQLYLVDRGEGRVDVRVAGATGAVMQVLSDAGCVAAAAVSEADQRWELSVPPSARYVRAQVLDTVGNALAISNPIWTQFEPAD